MSAPNSSEGPVRSFRFLELPPELRSRIYEYYFANHTASIWLWRDDDVNAPVKAYSRAQDAHLQLAGNHVNAVLRTCKQIHHEATKPMEETIKLEIMAADHLLPSILKQTSGQHWEDCFSSVPLSHLSSAQNVKVTVRNNPVRSLDEELAVQLVESWLAFSKGASLVKYLEFEIAHYCSTQRRVDGVMRLLEDKLCCDRAEGNVSGSLVVDRYCDKERRVQAFDELIRRLKGEGPAGIALA